MNDVDSAAGGSVKGPAPRPCSSCPYRRDVPSGIWAGEEYERLRVYDEPTYLQPPGLFLCHQNDAGSPQSRLCAGWVGCHGQELLGVRLAARTGELDADTVAACATYRSPVPLFGSGAEAAEHGTTDLAAPDSRALAAIDKIAARRSLD